MKKPDDSLESSAVKALLLRHAEAWWERAFLNNRMAEDKKRVGELSKRIADCDTSFRVFGFDVKDKEVWKNLVNSYMDEIEPLLAPLSAKWPSGSEEDEAPEHGSLPQPEQQPIHQMVLDRLKDAGAKGSKAAPIRIHIEGVIGREIHEKTVGMTLYRLLKQGRVRRDGHTWFYVSPSGETKNPGGGTPGLINRDTKEGEEL